MSAPITHVVLAKKFLNTEAINNFNEKKFIVGTSFPDIRYISNIPREKTHFKAPSFEQVKKEENSFTAGLKFHLLVDTLRVDYYLQNDLYSIIDGNSQPIKDMAAKLLEDRVLYEKVNNWDLLSNYFGTIFEEEHEFGIAEEEIQEWHNILRGYFKKNPSLETLKGLFTKLKFPKEQVTLLINCVEKNGDNKELIKGMNEMYNNFGTLLEKY